MFQTFTTPSTPETGAARLAQLRTALSQRGIEGFLVPRSDAHQGENVAPHDERLAWLTGFTGSAGFCVVLQDSAGVFVDGRYTLQVRKQIDLSAFTPQSLVNDKLSEWLLARLPEGARIGYDPMLHTVAELEALESALEGKLSLCPTENPIDAIWRDQPAPPTGKITPYPIEFAGVSSAEKRVQLATTLRDNDLCASVLTLPDSICWLLNIRGSDIVRAPLVLAFAILHDDARVDLFTDPRKASPELLDHLGDQVTLHPNEAFQPALNALKSRVGIDKKTAPIWVCNQIQHPVNHPDPCVLPKARKNPAELAGTRTAHRRDAVAMCEFLAWLAQADHSGLTEIDVVTRLESFRRNTNALTDISFDTICGAGPNGAIVHYRVDDSSNAELVQDSLLLVDSGGQYLDGTTDITRTVAIGQPDHDMIRAFTLVLQGMINLSMLRWPRGLSGQEIDAMARAPLWAAGFDYDHGTGHGVGAYLGVHEGPASISRRGTVALDPGMILSNEPGYYRENAWGIRIENLVVVTPPETPEGGDRAMLGFETLTWVPIDRALIDPTQLTPVQQDWLNSYHRAVFEMVSPHVSPATLDWLQRACAPV